MQIALIIVVVLYSIGAGLAVSKNSQMKRNDYKGIPWIQCFSPIKMLSFCVGMMAAKFKDESIDNFFAKKKVSLITGRLFLNPFNLFVPDFIIEQFWNRWNTFPCRFECAKTTDSKCIENTKCACSGRGLLFSPFESCPTQKYVKFFWRKSKWIEYKKLNNLQNL